MKLRKHADRPMLLASGSKAGGSAKTSVLLATTSLALLAGLRVGIIDADAAGTSAISHRVQHPDVQVIPLVEGTRVPALLDQFADRDIILVDVGANELLQERTFATLARLAQRIGGRDGNAAMLVSQIPHKANIIDDMRGTVNALGDLLDIHIVQQNIDRTRAFETLPPSLATLPRHEVPYLTPAVLNMALPTGWVPADFIRHGLYDYERLRGQWAAHLLHIATSNGFAHWLGIDAAIAVLTQIAPLAPRHPLPLHVSADRLTDGVVYCIEAAEDALARIKLTDDPTEILEAKRLHRCAIMCFDWLVA